MLGRLLPPKGRRRHRLCADREPATGGDRSARIWLRRRVGGTLGPRIEGKELVSLDGTIQGGSLVADCEENARRPDPTKLRRWRSWLRWRASRTRTCEGGHHPAGVRLPGHGRGGGGDRGDARRSRSPSSTPTATRAPRPASSPARAQAYEGAVQLRLPALPRPRRLGDHLHGRHGRVRRLHLLRRRLRRSWASNAPARRRSRAATSASSGCCKRPSGRSLAAVQPAIAVPAGLPHAGFAATGTTGPPLVTVSGPAGFTATSPADGSALRTPGAVIVPVPHENTTYVFVNDPKAGSWRGRGRRSRQPADPGPFLRGPARPQGQGEGRSTGKRKFRLSYSLREMRAKR